MWADFVAPASKPINLEPLFPVHAFTPHSPCPHNGRIRDDSSFCCMACDRASRLRDRIIDNSPAAKVEDPEARIARVEKMQKDGLLSADEVETVREWSAWVLDLIDPGPRPTKYRPPADGLKGGKG